MPRYMYGPWYTWDGFQLMGFQATIFRSGSRARQPINAWITPSEATNHVLKEQLRLGARREAVAASTKASSG